MRYTRWTGALTDRRSVVVEKTKRYEFGGIEIIKITGNPPKQRFHFNTTVLRNSELLSTL